MNTKKYNSFVAAFRNLILGLQKKGAHQEESVKDEKKKKPVKKQNNRE